MKLFEKPSVLRTEAYRCALQLWYAIVLVSLVLFQLPLYYLYKHSLMSLSEPYWSLFLHFTRNWCILMTLNLIGCLSTIRAVRGLYQPYWSAFGIRLATFLASEFMAAVVVLVYFALVYNNVIFPVYVVITVTMVSAAAGAWTCKLETLRTLLYKKACDME